MATGPMQLHTLIQRLLEKTQAGKLKWNERPWGDFETEVGGYVIKIEHASGRNARHPKLYVEDKRRQLVATGIKRDGECDVEITRLKTDTQKLLDELWSLLFDAGDIGKLIDQLA